MPENRGAYVRRSRRASGRSDDAARAQEGQLPNVGIDLPSPAEAAANWRQKVARGDGILTAYDRVSRFFPAKVSSQDLIAALDGLAAAFGDVAFAEAATVLRSYRFGDGALKRQVLAIVAEHRGTMADAAVPIMQSIFGHIGKRYSAHCRGSDGR